VEESHYSADTAYQNGERKPEVTRWVEVLVAPYCNTRSLFGLLCGLRRGLDQALMKHFKNLKVNQVSSISLSSH